MISYAVILGGGSGQRMGAGMNKVFLPLRGVPAIVRSIAPFSALCKGAVVVARAEEVEAMQAMVARYGLSRFVLAVVPGGVPAAVEPVKPAKPTIPVPAALTGGTSAPATEGEYTTIQRGQSGEAVLALQQRLTDLGYYSGKLSGKMDSATQLAFKKFEKANGFTANGVASPEEQMVLYSQEAVAAQ